MSATEERETTTTISEEENVGRIEEIQGVVIEAVFPDKLPAIYNAIKVKRPAAAVAEEDEDIAASQSEWLICEVQQHLGDDRIRVVRTGFFPGTPSNGHLVAFQHEQIALDLLGPIREVAGW